METPLAGIGWVPLDPVPTPAEQQRQAELARQPERQQPDPPPAPEPPPAVVEPSALGGGLAGWQVILIVLGATAVIGAVGALWSTVVRRRTVSRRRRLAEPATAVRFAWRTRHRAAARLRRRPGAASHRQRDGTGDCRARPGIGDAADVGVGRARRPRPVRRAEHHRRARRPRLGPVRRGAGPPAGGLAGPARTVAPPASGGAPAGGDPRSAPPPRAVDGRDPRQRAGRRSRCRARRSPASRSSPGSAPVRRRSSTGPAS